MRDWFALIAHVIVTTIRVVIPGGARAVIAESLLLKHQLLILNRPRKKAPRLRPLDRILLGLGAMLVAPQRSTEGRSRRQARDAAALPRGTGPTKVSMVVCYEDPASTRAQGTVQGTDCRHQRLNPRFGCPRIAQQISHAFGLEIDKDVVRRILANHPRPKSGGGGPSWLSAIAEARDSLWSVDLFRCESILLKSFWVMVVMDVFSRRIVGFGVEPAPIDGICVCRMFNQARSGEPFPKRLSSDHDPLFRFHRWRANLRVLDVEELKSIPFVPRSHPFVERLIGTLRREYLDQTFFWNGVDLHRKLDHFATYYNERRVHAGLSGQTPLDRCGATVGQPANLDHFAWRSDCSGLFHTPIAA